jgi:hypothetical protein
LGQEVLDTGDSFVVTRHTSGRISILMWNYCHYTADSNDSRSIQKAVGSHQLYEMFEQKPEKQFNLRLSGVQGRMRIQPLASTTSIVFWMPG